MAFQRPSSLGSVLLVGGLLLVALAFVVFCVVPLVVCPACLGWLDDPRYAGFIKPSSQGCRYCKGTSKSTLLRKWLITRKEGRPCYYMNHDE